MGPSGARSWGKKNQPTNQPNKKQKTKTKWPKGFCEKMCKSQLVGGDLEIAAMAIFSACGWVMVSQVLGWIFNNLSTVPEGLNLLRLCLFHPGCLSRQVFLHPVLPLPALPELNRRNGFQLPYLRKAAALYGQLGWEVKRDASTLAQCKPGGIAEAVSAPRLLPPRAPYTGGW